MVVAREAGLTVGVAQGGAVRGSDLVLASGSSIEETGSSIARIALPTVFTAMTGSSTVRIASSTAATDFSTITPALVFGVRARLAGRSGTSTAGLLVTAA